jgi:protein phosphatase
MSQRTQLGAIALLCAALETGEIADVEKLYDRLESIAYQFQNSDTPTTEPLVMLPEESKLIPANVLGNGSDTVEEITEGEPASVAANVSLPLDESATALNAPMGLTRLEASLLDDDTAAESDDIPTVVLPMKLIQIEDAGRTDVGRQRDHNEDFFTIQTELSKVDAPAERSLQFRGLYILCDGMGGHAGGEVASTTAVNSLKEYFHTHWTDSLPSEEVIRGAIQFANKTIYDLNQASDRSGVGRMGTTLLMVLVQDTQLAIAHVGDSRLYRFSRRRGLEQITTDHEVGQREMQRGVEASIAYARPDAYQLTQALGPRDENFVNPDVQFLELNEDALLLLCSDGLTDNDLLETHSQTHVEPLISSQVNLEQGVSQLIDLANQYNGHDNITAVAIRVKVRPNLELLKR